MSFVKNPILLPLQGMIGLTPTPKPLVLDDTNISLTLPLAPEIIRRSSTQAPSTGLFVCQMQNEHVAAGTLSISVDPYLPANPGAIWQGEVPEEFDCWLLGVGCAISVGDIVDLDDCSVEISSPETARGWSITTGGGAITGNLSFTQIAHWGQGDIVDTTRKKGIWRPIGLRWRRGDNLFWISDSNLVGNFDIIVTMIWGLFPAGLGQDGLV